MSQSTFVHVVRADTGSVVSTLRCMRDANTTHLEWRDAGDDFLLVAHVIEPGATRLLDGAGQDLPIAAPRANEPAEPAVRVIGSNTVMRSWEVAGHPAWVIDDYGNRERHFVFGCTPELFLHLHLGVDGSTITTEKTSAHTTLRVAHRATSGALIADQAVVQPGEQIEAIALRCGTSAAALLAANPALPDAPGEGTQIRLP